MTDWFFWALLAGIILLTGYLAWSDRGLELAWA